MTKATALDDIIIGSGSAGSTLAGRLSEDPGTSVLLIEAGPRDKSIHIQMPAALGVPLTNDRFNCDISLDALHSRHPRESGDPGQAAKSLACSPGFPLSRE